MTVSAESGRFEGTWATRNGPLIGDAPTEGAAIFVLVKVPARGQPNAPARPSGTPKAESEMILDDEDAVTRDVKTRHRARPFAARDRFTVDKDAPDRERVIRWDLLDEEDKEDELDHAAEEAAFEVDATAIARAIASADDADQPRAHLFEGEERPRPAPGDPHLHDPSQAMAALGNPKAYAQHALLLSESFRRSCGATRKETIAYLGELFVSLPDEDFARSALREFGVGTGILEIYPLEVVAHLLERAPSFLPRTTWGQIVERPAPGEDVFGMETFRALTLHVPSDRTIRGFALVGGARPGYRFEPSRSPDQYRLVIGAPGTFEILLAARGTDASALDRFWVEVEGTAEPAQPPPDLPRDEARLAAWPRPRPRPRSEPEEPSPTSAEPASLLSQGERWLRAEQDALRGPKGEEVFYDERRPSAGEPSILAPARVCKAEGAPVSVRDGSGDDATDVEVPAHASDPSAVPESSESSLAVDREFTDATDPDVPIVRGLGALEPVVSPPPSPPKPTPPPPAPRRAAPLIGEDDTNDLP